MTKRRTLTAATIAVLLLLAIVFIVLKPFDDHSSGVPSAPVRDMPSESPSPSPELSLLEEYEAVLYDEGWQRISETQASSYLELVTFGYLPEGSELGGVYVLTRGTPDETMLAQLWCAPDRSWLLQATQYTWDGPDMVGDVQFSGWDEGGGQISDNYPWAAHYCAQQVVRDGVSVYIYMLVCEDLDAEFCGGIMRSLSIYDAGDDAPNN